MKKNPHLMRIQRLLVGKSGNRKREREEGEMQRFYQAASSSYQLAEKVK